MASVDDPFAAAIRHHQSGNLQAAASGYRAILRRDPGHASACHMLGVVAHQIGNHQQAVDLIRDAIALHPTDAAFHGNLGIALKGQGRLGDAISAYRRALELNPNYVEAHSNLGNVLRTQGKLEEAVACYRRALELNPNFADAHSNLGAALRNLGTLSEAVASCRRAIALMPNHAEAHLNLGNTLRDQGNFDAAVAEFKLAMQLRPGYADAHWNHSLLLLARADFVNGWEEYEWRWKLPKANRRSFSAPVWDGARLPGRTLLVHAEQGLGDSIQFARYLSMLGEMVERVVFECQEPLVRLMQGLTGANEIIARGDKLPPFDAHIPLASLPRVFGTSLSTIPADGPYLFAEPALVEDWQQQFSPDSNVRVGICWQGNPDFPGDRQRSIPLHHFTPLASNPHVHLIALQKDNGLEQLRALEGAIPIVDLSAQLNDFGDTAAVMMNLDLVISSDTSVAHLAGAMGVPVWLATQFAADWRWLREREDSPWYPTMRLFRQAEFGDWAAVFERIAAALADHVGGERDVSD